MFLKNDKQLDIVQSNLDERELDKRDNCITELNCQVPSF